MDITNKLLIEKPRIGEILIFADASPFGDGSVFNVRNILHVLPKNPFVF